MKYLLLSCLLLVGCTKKEVKEDTDNPVKWKPDPTYVTETQIYTNKNLLTLEEALSKLTFRDRKLDVLKNIHEYYDCIIIEILKNQKTESIWSINISYTVKDNPQVISYLKLDSSNHDFLKMCKLLKWEKE